MGFLDKVKKAFGSKKEDVESQNSVNDEVIDEPTFTESIEKDNGNFNDDEEIHLSDSEEIPANDEVIDKPTPNDKIRNFKYLDELIHSGTKEIVLGSDIVLEAGEESQYLDGINLDICDLVIDGNGHTIDAQGKTRIFYCTEKNITIKNIILKNGSSEDDGGAIKNKGSITITESTLNENTSGGHGGGAIYNDKGQITIHGSILNENTLRGKYGGGGAIYNTGEITITESTLNNNTAQGTYSNGGAIYNSGELTITESTLTGNTAEYGGAIDNSYGELTITESTLTGNTAKSSGGAIYNIDGELTIYESTLAENTAQKYGGAIYNWDELTIYESTLTRNTAEDDGGAIYNIKGELTITESALTGNTAKSSGGAIFNRGGELTIHESTFTENIANGNGMDIFNNDGRIFTKENISNVIQIYNNGIGKFYHLKPLKNNQKDFNYLNKLIKTETNEIKLENDIVLNIRKYEQKTFKNGIEIDRDNLVIDGNGHEIDAQGFARIFDCTGKNITIKNITFKNGYSKDGGAINIQNGDVDIVSCQFQENTAKDYGGAIYNSDGELTITESTLNNNTANHYGGAIYNSYGELTITESTLTGNTSQEEGGAIYNSDGELTITESTLNNNTAKGGGAIYNSDGELTIHESTFTENIAKAKVREEFSDAGGGAIYNSYGELTIHESTLNNNTAEYRGGAINNFKGNFKIFKCEFSSNKSPNNIISNNDSLQIYNTIFKDNPSKYIVLNEGNGANLSIFYGEFSENNVEESVLCNTGKFCSVERTVFENNISDNKMNIINGSELTLINPKINDKGKSILNQNYILIRNSPPELENKICGQGTVENIDEIILQGESFDFSYLDEKIHESNTKEIILDHDITFENYEIDFYEGGIELDIDDLIINGNGHTIDGADKSRIFIITGKNITLKNIIFKNGHSHKNYDNPLNNNGGAIRINLNSSLTIENCEFLNNTSNVDGGAILNRSGGEITITESTLTRNTAEDDGGAILNYGSELTITESTLTGNTASKGGAVCNTKSGEIILNHSTFTENIAQKSGGAIFNRNGELTIHESTFTENIAKAKVIEKVFSNPGGGVIFNSSGGEITITESTLTGNTTTYRGGAICNKRNGEITITRSTLTGNIAQKSGGAIFNSDGELTIHESTLNNNTAKGGGGAIDNHKNNRGRKLIITESILTGNTAYIGGAILNPHSRRIKQIFLIENCTFKDNKPNDVDESK